MASEHHHHHHHHDHAQHELSRSNDAMPSVGGRRLLSVKKLVVGYHGRAVVRAVTFSVYEGQMWAIIGPNGAGKTTLLRTILGLLPALDGTAQLAEGVKIGYVPQRATLDPSVPARVVDIVRDGLESRWSFLDPSFRFRHRHDVEKALRDTETWELRRRQLNTLSEGQKQRVLMAQALVVSPSLLVLDEPTSAMDAENEEAIFTLLERLMVERQLGVMLVSHHLTVVGRFATHGLLIDADHDLILSGDIERLSEHDACHPRYGLVLQEGVARRSNPSLAALVRKSGPGTS